MEQIVKRIAAAIGAFAGLFGGWNKLMTVLAVLMALDYATGLIAAWRGKSPKTDGGGVSSKAGFDGLIRKALIMAVVLLATLLDTAAGNSARVFQTAATTYYIANEGISILENTALMGVTYPKFVMNALEALKQKADGNGRDDAVSREH